MGRTLTCAKTIDLEPARTTWRLKTRIHHAKTKKRARLALNTHLHLPNGTQANDLPERGTRLASSRVRGGYRHRQSVCESDTEASCVPAVGRARGAVRFLTDRRLCLPVSESPPGAFA